MNRSWMLAVALMLASTQCFAGSILPNVVVTTPPLKPYVDEILTGISSSQSLLRAGQDAHTFQLSGSQRKMLAEADVIIIPDHGMSPILNKLLAAEEKRGATIVELTALTGAQPLPYTTESLWKKLAQAEAHPLHTKKPADADEHEHAHEHEHAGTDPHLWLDPLRMAEIAAPLAQAMAVAAPSHRAHMLTNANALSRHLREDVHPKLIALLQPEKLSQPMSARPIVPFITYHAAYQYFLARYALTHYGEITQRPEDYLGAKTLHDLLDAADKTSIRCVITEAPSPLVARIATASGAETVLLSPEKVYSSEEVDPLDWVENDYDRFLLKTAQSFARCL